MRDYLTIKTHSSSYSDDQYGHALTISKLIDFLSHCNDLTSMYLSNNNGYTNCSINLYNINSA